MWGSQGWNQWALQPAMFNDVPHEQIDWAELAKQWIQMQQTQPSDSTLRGPPPVPQVSAIPPPPPPGHQVPLVPKDFPEKSIVPPLLKTPVSPPVLPEPFHHDNPFENEPAPFVPKAADSYWNKPEWEVNVSNDADERLWAPPPVEQAGPLLPGKETFDYGHVHDNPPLAMQSIDYNHMSEFSYNQMYPTPAPVHEASYDQYWSQVNATPTISPMFLKKERSTTSIPVEEEATQLDAAKKKQLPAWIRDGLEKMEQERLKRLERERAAKESAEKRAKMDLLKNNLDFKDGSSTTSAFTKSKFDSDSEIEETEEIESKRISPVRKRTPSPTEDLRTDEERKEELMLKVRHTLTEVLLSVTNTEMIDIAQEMFRKAVSKAPARQLASATPLSSVASGLRGLASYGTESEASEPEEGSSDSEEELYLKIREKKRLFAQKEKRIIAELERKEYEEKIAAEREKINNEKSSEKKSSKASFTPEKLEDIVDNLNDKNDSSKTHKQTPHEPNSLVEESVLSVSTEEIEENSKSNKIKAEILKPVAENSQSEKKESDSSDSKESSSSDSGEKHKKKMYKDTKNSKSESKKSRNSSKRSRRSKSRDSESSDKHSRERSREKKSRHSKKKKKYKRSDSSDSSSSSGHRRKHSSRYSSSHRERRSRSYDHKERRRKRSVSRSRGHAQSDHRSSRSHRYSGDKYKDEKKYYDHRHSPSPSRLPRKYRSRSLSSESHGSGKKSKKYRSR